jgi:glycosyltransferase involved in cell wall biosynthesis
MRDNALVAALARLGHDARTIPLYLPMTLDEESTAEDVPVFYGGINVYLQQKLPLFRRTPRWMDSLFDSAAMLKMAAGRSGSTDASTLGDLTISMLRGEEGFQVKELERLTNWLKYHGKPDVVCLSNALLMGMAREIRRCTDAPVICTLQGEDYFLDSFPPEERDTAWKTMAQRSKDVDAFIAVSRYYADRMIERASLPQDRVHVVYNGISLEGYDPALQPPSRPTIGFLSRMCPNKGLETLVEAFILIRQRNLVPNAALHIAGTVTASDLPYVERLQKRLVETGLEKEAEFQRNISRDEKIAFLRGLSVMSVPATYGESFGLYLLEAMAVGVPVVQPRHAAFPEILAETGGGILCEPNSAESLAASLAEILSDPCRARALGEEGRQAVVSKFSDAEMARQVLKVFEMAKNRESHGAHI